MSKQWYQTRKETFVIKPRMAGYERKEKLKESASRCSFLRPKLLEIIAPKCLVVDIYYPEEDYEYPIDINQVLPTKPGVTLKEVCLETGKVFSEFRISLEEAQALSKILKEKFPE